MAIAEDGIGDYPPAGRLLFDRSSRKDGVIHVLSLALHGL